MKGVLQLTAYGWFQVWIQPAASFLIGRCHRPFPLRPLVTFCAEHFCFFWRPLLWQELNNGQLHPAAPDYPQTNCLEKCVPGFWIHQHIYFVLYFTNSRPIDHLIVSFYLFIFLPFTTLMGGVFFRLSQEGLFHLLDNIERRLHCEQTTVYGDSSIDGRRLSAIIRYAHPEFSFKISSPSLWLNTQFYHIYLMAMKQFVQTRKKRKKILRLPRALT